MIEGRKNRLNHFDVTSARRFQLGIFFLRVERSLERSATKWSKSLFCAGTSFSPTPTSPPVTLVLMLK